MESYSRLMSKNNPGMILILLDQSGAMVTEVAEHPMDVILVTQKVMDGVGRLVDTELRMPIWVSPTANDGSPMAEAFEMAFKVVQRWVTNYPDCFPPVVVNICSDRLPFNEEKVKKEAESIKLLTTADGNVLLFNYVL